MGLTQHWRQALGWHYSGLVLARKFYDLQTHYAGYSYSDGCERFLKALASQLVHPTSATILQKRLIFVVGASGTGRTTMVAKIAAMLRDQNPSKEIVLASLNGQNGTTNHHLQSFGRLLNLPQLHWVC